MPQIKIEVSAQRKQFIEAAIQATGRTLEDLMEGYIRDIEASMGLDHGDTDDDKAAAVAKALRKAAKAETARKEAAAAVKLVPIPVDKETV